MKNLKYILLLSIFSINSIFSASMEKEISKEDIKNLSSDDCDILSPEILTAAILIYKHSKDYKEAIAIDNLIMHCFWKTQNDERAKRLFKAHILIGNITSQNKSKALEAQYEEEIDSLLHKIKLESRKTNPSIITKIRCYSQLFWDKFKEFN